MTEDKKNIIPVNYPSPVTEELKIIIRKYFENKIDLALASIIVNIILIFCENSFILEKYDKETIKQVAHKVLQDCDRQVDKLVDQMYQIIQKLKKESKS